LAYGNRMGLTEVTTDATHTTDSPYQLVATVAGGLLL